MRDFEQIDSLGCEDGKEKLLCFTAPRNFGVASSFSNVFLLAIGTIIFNERTY